MRIGVDFVVPAAWVAGGLSGRGRGQQGKQRPQNSDADGQHRAEFDGQLVFHLPESGLLLVEFLLQFGPEFLKLISEGEFQCAELLFQMFLGNQAFIKFGLPLGEDFSLVLGIPAPVKLLTKAWVSKVG